MYLNSFFIKFSFSFIVLIITLIVVILIKKGIDVIFAGVKGNIFQERLLAKTRTIRTILKGIVDIVFFLIAGLIVLSHWGVNIIPILTGASILGLAVSFGSQTLIKDFISGFFILLEDQYSIGDKVKIGNFEGEVQEITLRLTILKDSKGNQIFIPNSQATTVIRMKTVKRTILP